MVLPVPNFQYLTGLGRSVLASVTCGTLLLAVGAMIQRWRSDRFDRRVKRITARFGLSPAALLGHKFSAQGLSNLRTLPPCSLELLLEPLLLKCGSTPPLVNVLREICLELGLIDMWQRQILGQFPMLNFRQALSYPDGLLHVIPHFHFLLRARSARNLGLLRHQASWPILVKALDDPHPDVQQVALGSLAALRQPQSFPTLLDRMDQAVAQAHSPLSLHSLKAAMASFPLSLSLQLLPALRHPHPHVRSAAVEILREMAKHEPAGTATLVQFKSVFAHELAKLTCDIDQEVRTIAGEVVAQFALEMPNSRSPAVSRSDA